MPITTTRFTDGLQRQLDLRSVEQVDWADRIVPVLPVEPPNCRSAALYGDRVCGAYIAQAPVVGQYGQLLLENPVGSGFIAEVFEVWHSEPVARAKRLGIAAAPGVATTDGFVHDWRWFSPALPGFQTACKVGSRAVVAQTLVNPCALWGTTQNRTMVFGDRNGWVITPGSCFMLEAFFANEQVECNIFWRERMLLPAETRLR